MKYASLNAHTYMLRLEVGDDIHSTLQDFCAVQHIYNAGLQGIGSVESPTLAHYSIETKQFTTKQLDGIFEVTSLLGNIAVVNAKPFAHIHVTISDLHMHTFGGHLMKGEASATLEVILTAYDSHHTKSHDEAIGLKVWDFQH
jgi:uncharacterized protein